MPKKKKLSPVIEAQRAKIKLELHNTLKVAAVESVNFFTANFKRQGFLDRSLKPWKPRKRLDKAEKGKRPKKRNILTKEGFLKKSLYKRVGYKTALIGVQGLPRVYASIHNFGLQGKAFGKHPFKMPKRQFIGESHKLNNKITRIIRKRLNKIF